MEDIKRKLLCKGKDSEEEKRLLFKYFERIMKNTRIS